MERADKLFKRKMSYEFIFEHLMEGESIKKGLLKDEKNCSMVNNSNKNINESAKINREIPSNEPKKYRHLILTQTAKK